MPPLARAAELSKAVFGSEHMLSVMWQISQAPDATFNAPAIERATGLAGSIVHGMLARLKRAGLIEVVGHLEGERTLAYQRRDHLVWQAASQLTSEVTDTLGIGGPYDS